MNFQITQGSGTTIATDTGGGGENYQKVKLIDATPGSTAGTGILSNPLRIDPTGTTPQPINGTVTSNIGTTGGLALDATVASLVVGQGTLTSGQRGVLNVGAVTTSAPSYTNGTSNALSLTLVGNLRVDGSSVIQPVSGTVTAVQSLGSDLHVNIDAYPATPQDGNLVSVSGSALTLGQTTMTASIPVTFASDQTALPPPTDIAVTGTLGSLVDTVVINCNGLSTIGWTTSGTWSGTMVMEVQYGDLQWFLTEVIDTNLAGDGKPFIVTSWTETLNNDPWITNVGGATQARIRFTSYTSGTATIVFNGSVGINAVRTYNLNPSTFLSKAWMQDGTGNPLTSTVIGAQRALDVNIAGGVTIDVNLDHTTDNVLVYGNDGTTDRKIKTDASGNTEVVVTNFPATTAVTQSTSPWVVSLASTTITGTVASTQSGVWSVGRTWTLSSGTDSIAAIQSGTWNINNISGTISLPTGAATETTLAGIKTSTDKFTFSSTRLLVDGSGVTQPISGSISIINFPATQAVTQSGTWNINNISGTISLPTGACTSLNQTNGNQKTQIVDGSGNVATVVPLTSVLSGTELGIVTNSLIYGKTTGGGGGYVEVKVTPSGSLTADVSGSSVTANIGTTNGLALDSSVTGLQVSQGSSTSGQKGSLTLGAVTTTAPTYTTAQSSPLSLTTAGALRTDSSATTQPVSGTVTANAGTGNFTVVQATGTNLHTVLDSGTLTSITNALPTGSNTIGAVTQASGPWTINQTQINGSAVSTAAAGIAKVGLTDGTGNAISSTSGALNITNIGGNVSLGISTGKTLVMKTGTLVTTAVTADQVVLTYTVTAGKTFYLEYISLFGSLTTPANTASVVGTISLETPSGTKVYSTRFTNSSVGTFQSDDNQFAEPLPIPATTVIRVVTTPGVTTSITWLANFGGYEV